MRERKQVVQGEERKRRQEERNRNWRREEVRKTRPKTRQGRKRERKESQREVGVGGEGKRSRPGVSRRWSGEDPRSSWREDSKHEKQRRKARKKGIEMRKAKGEEQGGVQEWKEEIARVGTGYRVRKDEKDGNRRWFDVGYSDRKTYKRKPGREAKVDQSNTGRTVIGKGRDARVKVMNAVVQIEKRRPASEYTGSGIRRKSRVGKLKLKPTKPQAKQ